jgi:Protein of unknown function (DUF3667)
MQNPETACKNCGHVFQGRYCNNCGEKVYRENDKKVFHFFEEGLHFITHFEGTLFTTLKTILAKPGRLSTDYCNGTRKKYFKPLSFYLLLIVLYLVFPFFEGLNMKLKNYQRNKYFGVYAKAEIKKVMDDTGYTEEKLSEVFHSKSEKSSKFLLIILIPLTALFIYGAVFYKRKYFFDQMVFAAELNAFFLLWGFLLLPVILVVINGAIKVITGNPLNIGEAYIGLLIYGVWGVYLAIAAKTFYGFYRWRLILFSLWVTAVHMIIVFILYKFILFVTVINLI